MKKQLYQQPQMEQIDIAVEQGFAFSQTEGQEEGDEH